MRKVCFYHAGCPDGFGSAWAAWKSWGDDAQYIPRGHNESLRCTDYEGDLVVFVDNVPSLQILRKLGEITERLIVLDHHISSQQRYQLDPELSGLLEQDEHLIHFDLDRSGAVLSWMHFHPGETVPPLLQYVEDQDLWNWKLPRSEDVNAALGSYPHSFEVWSDLAERPIEELADEGAPIVRAGRVQIGRALSTAHEVTLGNQRVEAVNNTSNLRSSIGHELALRSTYGAPIGLVYRLHGKSVDVSLYSIGDFDVSKLAMEYGGGGHKNAAGFNIPLHDWVEFLP